MSDGFIIECPDGSASFNYLLISGRDPVTWNIAADAVFQLSFDFWLERGVETRAGSGIYVSTIF